MGEWFATEIVAAGKLRLFCFFVFFIGTFVFIRISVRLIRARVRWWPGNVTSGGLHIHHVVFGVVFMCVGGVSGLAVQDVASAAAGLLAGLFGAGTALVLDEFALVVLLDDVYWKEQGRLSVDAVFVAAAMCGLALLGASPLELDDVLNPGPDDDLLSTGQIAFVVGTNLALSVVALGKGKIWTGLIGIYITPLALVGAIRLARPGSPWARRRYKPGSRSLRRAEWREHRIHQPIERFVDGLQNLVAGRPSPKA
ncbi:hypothetical protein FHS43_002486 [Streptosporangium becharense]|uniref:Integral membrane protein n=1 Tax=Streptosporangium becharense TaxID=1816182 RepID=A0A7W9IK22_9ACTN|nr:hypothetical protein [Streptosporangium becharense]MBB2911221.1 hypothetical protein [Streptosporangium becharense]MBB5821721.1 hypothetical protein [Streptosporangium becharense]